MRGMRQLGWYGFQTVIIFFIGRWAMSTAPPPSMVAVGIFALLVAALLSGLLAALFRLIRRALGRETIEDRQWREWRGPRSPLDLRSPRDLAGESVHPAEGLPGRRPAGCGARHR